MGLRPRVRHQRPGQTYLYSGVGVGPGPQWPVFRWVVRRDFEVGGGIRQIFDLWLFPFSSFLQEGSIRIHGRYHGVYRVTCTSDVKFFSRCLYLVLSDRTCPFLVTPSNAELRPGCPFVSATGVLCTHACAEGYKAVSGDSKRMCMSTLQWSGQSLLCKRKYQHISRKSQFLFHLKTPTVSYQYGQQFC